jgi:hypothetical protein
MRQIGLIASTAFEEALDEAWAKLGYLHPRPSATIKDGIRYCRCGETMERAGVVWICDCGYRRFY